jgi:hypothetical protein
MQKSFISKIVLNFYQIIIILYKGIANNKMKCNMKLMKTIKKIFQFALR